MIDLAQRVAKLTPAQQRILEQKLRHSHDVVEPIAIVGMGCRFPGASSLAAYWRLIMSGQCATGEIPADRWDADEYYDADPDAPGKMATRWGGFVENGDTFDPVFFGITPREAARMDPQQRLLLEVVWEALEQGGLAPERMAGTATGVFVGIGGSDYSKIPSQYQDCLTYIDAHVGTGNALSIAANRISYLFDFHGPSVAVDTACSSGLVGVHLAVQALRSRECDAAVAGGVNMILSPEVTMAFSKARMLSPTGECRPFDAAANGYVRGEGCGMIVLKRLTDAVRAGDNVLALIRGTAINQDGRTSGITAPNGLSQQACIKAALASAGLTPERVSYVEAHGTGTPLGDPIEVQALTKVFAKQHTDDPPCHMSSVKANIGHLETASGMAGMIKAVLMMQHGVIPAQARLEKLNPHMKLEGSRMAVSRETIPWHPAKGGTRIAGVSSFGFGGTNAHVVLEEAAAAEPAKVEHDRPLHLAAISGKSKPALAARAQQLIDWLAEHPDASIADVCHSANIGRSHFHQRAALVAGDRETLLAQLAAVAQGEKLAGGKIGQVKAAARPKIAFLFTGQGSQYVGMGRQLYETHPVFREAIDRCAEILNDQREESLLDVLYPPEGKESPLNETSYTQPALFAIEYALATLWRSWGIEPSYVLGHSVGEYVAACVAGVFTLEEGLSLIAERARLMQQLPPGGAMVVLFTSADQIRPVLAKHGGKVDLAALNGPENTVISGEQSAIDQVVAEFEARGVKAQRLTVSHAFHSSLMEPILDDFESFAATIDFRAPRIPILSNLTGQLLEQETPDAKYWRNHIRLPVQFAAGIERLAQENVDVLLEVGPAPVLLGMGRRCLPESTAVWTPSLRKGTDEWTSLLGSVAEMYVAGVKFNWGSFDKPWPRRRLSLPTYPFERMRCWFDLKTPKRVDGGGAPRGPAVHPLLGSNVPTALKDRVYEGRLSVETVKYLADHVVQGSVVTPAAAYIEQALAAARLTFGDGNHAIENLAIQQAMFLPEGTSRTVQVTVSPEVGGQSTVEVYSVPSKSDNDRPQWQLHAVGRIRHGETLPAAEPARPVDFEEFAERGVDVQEGDKLYATLAARGLAYGPMFRGLKVLRRSPHDALAEIELPEAVATAAGDYLLHPSLGDACLQAFSGAIPLEADGSYSPYTYLPVAIRQLRRYRPMAERMFVYVVRTSENARPSPETCEGNVYLLDEQGEVIVEILGFRVQRIGRPQGAAREADPRSWLYELAWRESPAAGEDAKRLSQGTWAVLADGEMATAIAGQIAKAGGKAIVAAGDKPFEQIVAESKPAITGVIFASTDLAAALKLIQQLARSKGTPPELFLVTHQAQALADDSADMLLSPFSTALWGLGRVAQLEHPELKCRLVDLAGDAATATGDLARELALAPNEDQIAWRSGKRFAARLAPADEAPAKKPGDSATSLAIPAEGSFRLRLVAAGSFDGLKYESCPRRTPGKGQIELEVRATGLNFSDVLKALGLYPGLTDEIVPLGIECAGIVTALGEGVDRFQIGDEVMGVVPYSFASHAITADYAMVKKPRDIDYDEAATIPITFLTAYYALVHLARLAPGERLLIHAGAGGVGLAALQIAQQIGATVYATAGSEEKREFLRALGVENIYSSRNTEFAEQILRETNREGVDVVLNSLPGEAITRSLDILKAYGRFLEIGKTDIYSNRMIGLLPFQNNLSYFAIDLDRMLRQRPEYILNLFAEVMREFEAGHYRPLSFTRFPAADTTVAFRYMAQRKNIGKVVVALDERPAEEDTSPAEDTSPERQQREESEQGLIREDGVYVITGGTGALGLRLAQWLAQRGAGTIALLSRRPASEEVQAKIRELSSGKTQIRVVHGDVSDRASLDAALAELRASGSPLRGVIHAAGVLADGVLFDMTEEQLNKALAPKVAGGWNLHEATASDPLDFFILFSSIAGLLGSPGQGNYAAGNAFLDGLAHARRRQGLPATSVNWGPWADSGMAASEGRDSGLAARGLTLLPPDKAIGLLEELLRDESAQAAVLNVRWGDMLKNAKQTPPLLREVAPAGEATPAAENAADVALRGELLALDPAARTERLKTFFRDQLAHIMGLSPESIDAEQPLNTLGLDSLMAIELKNNIETRLKVVLPIARFMEGPSVTTLAGHVSELFGAGGAAVAEVAAGEGEASGAGRFPLAHGQQALWFLYQLAPQSTAYNICDAVTVRGALDVEALRSAVQTLVDRHPAFRTSFPHEEGVPYQLVHAAAPANVRVEDASRWSEPWLKQQLTDVIHEPFNLEDPSLLRVTIFHRSAEEHLLVFVVHHIVSDFWSLVTCTGEFKFLYEAAAAKRTLDLPAIRLKYTDFVAWQRAMIDGVEGHRQWEYWREQLAGELPVLNLPTDRPRPSVQTYNGRLAFRWWRPELAEALKRLGERHGATLNMVLLANWLLLLKRHSGQEEVLVGAPTSGRTRAEFAPVVGYFVNPVVIRGRFGGNPAFAEVLEQVRDSLVGALDNQDFPFPLLVERLAPERDPSRSPLVQAMFVMQKAQIMHEEGLTPFLMGQSGATLEMAGLKFDSMTLEQWVAQFDVSLACSEANGGISLGLQYNTDLFDAATIERILDHLEVLAESVIADEQQPIGGLALLTGGERQEIVADWNSTEQPHDLADLVHHRIERQVVATPEQTAVVCGDSSLTFREVNERANRLAHHLRTLRVGPDVRVGVCLERGCDLIVAIQAVLKAGGAYVPLDPNYPSQRLETIATSAGMSVVVTHERHLAALGGAVPNVVALDRAFDAGSIAAQPATNPEPLAGPDNLIYVIYTSGSTGEPKGAAVYHRGFANLMGWFLRDFAITGADRTLVITSHGFDLTQKNLYAALMTGGQMHLSTAAIYDPEHIAGEIARGVTILNCTPSNFYGLVEHAVVARFKQLASLRALFLGGEPIDMGRMAAWVKHPSCHAEIVNTYGPTECTDICCSERMARPAEYLGRTVPLGRAVDNVQVYLLDANLQPVPVGVIGELCIGGAGVGAGYINDAELTARRFVPNLFSHDVHARLYRTGDLCRYWADGRIEFVGRADHQVKIRGFRIELGEIEAAIRTHERIRDCVVLAREDQPGSKRLVAYVVADPGAPVTAAELTSFLRAKLPPHMLPAAFVLLEKLPLTPHGKLDRRSLPAPEVAGTAREYVAPRNEREQVLCEVWAATLRATQVGVHDNFFELGGDSISTIQVVARVRERAWRITPAQMFQHQTVAELAALMQPLATSGGSQAPVIGPVALAPGQAWFFAHESPRPEHFNQVLLLELDPTVDAGRVRHALQHLMEHHDALRLRFTRDQAGDWRQENAPPSHEDFFRTIDLTSVAASEVDSAMDREIRAAHASLNLAEGPVIRAAHFQLPGDRRERLLLVIHHLATDAVSWRILLEDLHLAYYQLTFGQTISLPAKTSSFQSWAGQIDAWSRSPEAADVAGKWLKIVQQGRPMPVDRPGPNLAGSIELLSETLDADASLALTEGSATVQESLLAALAAGYARWSGGIPAFIGLAIHGRDALAGELDLTRSVGWFSSFAPLVLPAATVPSARLTDIRQQVAALPDRGVSYAAVRYLREDALGNELRAAPRPSLYVNYLGNFDQVHNVEGMLLRPLHTESGLDRAAEMPRDSLVELDAFVSGGRLTLRWNYSRDLFDRDTIARLAGEVRRALAELVERVS